MALAVSAPVMAQDYEDEIIVTATKRSQTLQEVPIAVSVTSGKTIEQAKILDIVDLQTVVPSLRVTQLQNSAQTNFTIRGFGNGANNAGIEPSVGVFIDGVYRSRSAGSISDLPNLERVEVLRGPQSTLFGKNASAGVISVVTAKPTFETEGFVEAGFGNYDQKTLKGYVSGPINDKFAFSLGGSTNKRDGYYENLLTGVDQNQRDRWSIRGQALYEPNDDISLRVIVDKDKIDEICCGVANVVAGPTADIITGGGLLTQIGLPVEDQGGLGANLVPNDLFAYEGYYDFDPTNKIENDGISFHADWNVSDALKLTSITSFRGQEVDFEGDVDFTSAKLVASNRQITSANSFTQELRANFEVGDKANVMVGGFYFEDDLTTDTRLVYGDDFRGFADYNVYLLQVQAFNAGTGGAPFPLGGALSLVELFSPPGTSYFAAGQGLEVGFDQKNEALSLFGQVDFDVTDRLTATGGLSYVEDKKKITSRSVSTDEFSALDLSTFLGGALSSLVPLQFLPPFLDIPNAVEGNTSNDDKITYTARLAYDVKDNINVYASAGTGFKASTWNLSRDARPTATDLVTIIDQGLGVPNLGSGTRFADPENSTVYEVGVKAKLDRGFVNVAVFDQTIKGFQSNVFSGTGFNLANAGKQSAKGIEVDAAYSPVEGLNITGGLLLIDPVYDSFEGASGPGGTVVDLSGTEPAGIHKTSWSLGGVYDFSLAGRDAYLRADWVHESKVQAIENVTEAEVGDNAFRQVDSINASMGFNINDALSLQLWGRNIFNDEYPLQLFRSVAQEGSFSGYPNAPRTYGGSLRWNFD